MTITRPAVSAMSRVVILAFVVGMTRQLWQDCIAGWPVATLAIAVLLALPVIAALERAAPAQIIALLGRLGPRTGGQVR